MAPFLYRKIGQRLLDDLREKVIASRESVVLIAPRYGGKRYLMNRLLEMLKTEELFHVLQLHPRQQTMLTKTADFQAWLSKEVQTVDGRFKPSTSSSNNLFAPLDWLIAQTNRPVVLLVSNVDSLSQLLARELLLKVRTLVEERKLIVGLSGEDIFQKLVHGPASEFNCANQYFLQGFDRELFAIETAAYVAALKLQFDGHKTVSDLLYELSGGQLSTMKALLRHVINTRIEQQRPLANPISTAEIPTSMSPDLLRQPPRVINNASECWEDLKQLLRGEVSCIGANPLEPSPLELAGVAVRDGWSLRLASPIMQKFLKTYYTYKRLGDLYVRNDDFERAFVYYEQLPEEERVRPSNADDRREASFTIKALAAELHFTATKNPEAVGKLFFKTCRYVLGFREVGCLQLNGEWRPVIYPGCHLDQETVKELIQLLPKNEPKIGPLQLKGTLEEHALAAIAPTDRPDQFIAVIVSDESAGRTISTERRRLTNQLLEHFVEAYKQATQIVAADNHFKARENHIKIANSIFNGLGSSTRDVKEVIRLGAGELRNLGYQRVSFCLVDPERKFIRGVLDVSDDNSVDVASLTNYPLDNPRADIQPYVIHTHRPVIVPDAANEPLVNSGVREKAHLKAFAVVPLFTQTNEAIGTIHVERKDGFVPSLEEVGDLEQFGRQLTVAILQSERVSLQQAALDQIMSPLMIVDSTFCLRYANQKAANQFSVQVGWQDQAQAGSLTQEIIGEEAINLLKDSLAGQQRERHISLPQDVGDEHYWEALSDTIRDKNGQILGAFIRIRELGHVHRMFKAFSLIADATDRRSALAQLLKAGQHLGFKWGRLYLVDAQDPETLVSHSYFTTQPVNWEDNFIHGLRMPRRERPGKESWLCLDKHQPMVFYYDPNRPDGSRYITAKGQEATVIGEPRMRNELLKKPGDFWVDLPLLTQAKQPIGKFTFEWSEQRWPREFELLEVLAEMVSHVLEAFQQRERQAAQMQAVQQQTAQKIMGTMAHNIGTQLAALPVLLDRYELRERELPSLGELNRRFAFINEETSKIINRAKERLTGVSPKLARLNLNECLRQTLGDYLDEKVHWHIDCLPDTFEIEADSYLLKLALNELLQNSKDANKGLKPLEIRIHLEYRTQAAGLLAYITYRDNGPGVPTQFRERIFEDFFTYRPGGKPGTGLGMGFVRRVAEAHGGQIIERGIPGMGVEFVITLPVNQAAENQAATASI